MIENKLYKLRNSIQHYEWGTKNEKAFIPNLLGIEVEKDLPYAELWIGAHPKAPSYVQLEEGEISLIDFIKSNPSQILGDKVFNKYGDKLPFLLKILSIQEPLSIQLHPDKNNAVTLHSKDPKNYPDDNHKPEIAIAIDNLTALGGFHNYDIIKNIIKYIDPKLTKNKITKDEMKIIFDKLIDEYFIGMNISEKVKKIFSSFDRAENDCDFHDYLKVIFIKNVDTKYSDDIGQLVALFLKLLFLEKDEAIFIDSGIPHAYILGNIVECMANSDNVIRAGLTPKYKDLKSMKEIIDVSEEPIKIIQPDFLNKYTYNTKAEEFQITVFKTDKDSYIEEICNDDKVAVILNLFGELTIFYNDNESVIIKKGETYLIPASLNKIRLELNNDTKTYYVTLP